MEKKCGNFLPIYFPNTESPWLHKHTMYTELVSELYPLVYYSPKNDEKKHTTLSHTRGQCVTSTEKNMLWKIKELMKKDMKKNYVLCNIMYAVMLRRTIFIQVISRRAHISELWTLLLNSSETRVYMKKKESTSHICIAGVCTTRDEKNIFFIATTMNVRWTRSGLWFRLISARWRV